MVLFFMPFLSVGNLTHIVHEYEFAVHEYEFCLTDSDYF